jgi:hypothetical protein
LGAGARAGGQAAKKKEFFFEKKNQKTFFHWCVLVALALNAAAACHRSIE